ncbi:MAG: GtrA family protein [Anaerolineae bacterium]|nr:GtrA family protein [Anaerolineae bacterium]
MKTVVAMLRRRPNDLHRFTKFLMVGVSSTLIDVGVFTILVQAFAVATLPANILSYSLGVADNFLLNRAWTYRDARRKSALTQFGQFLAINIVGLCLNSLLVLMFSATLQPWLGASAALTAKLISTAVVMFWNFFANRLWTFNDASLRPASS